MKVFALYSNWNGLKWSQEGLFTSLELIEKFVNYHYTVDSKRVTEYGTVFYTVGGDEVFSVIEMDVISE